MELADRLSQKHSTDAQVSAKGKPSGHQKMTDSTQRNFLVHQHPGSDSLRECRDGCGRGADTSFGHVQRHSTQQLVSSVQTGA